jgi:hypothetical protein
MGGPTVNGGKPIVPRPIIAKPPTIQPTPRVIKPVLTGIAKARSVGGNAYAKGQNRPKINSPRRMGKSMGKKGY